MKLSAEIIHERMLGELRAVLKEFHKKREQRYFEELNDKISNGTIDPYDDDYKQICQEEAQTFFDAAASETLAFIKNYIQESADMIIEAKREGVLDSEEAEIAFKFLKYILVAAEVEADDATKLA
jgi:hypothetical protein